MHTEAERFWSKVDKTPTCWLWNASVNGWGYGRFITGGRANRREWMAHRYSYEALIGPLPKDRPTLDHLCRVRRCVNPAHLEPVTARINNLRGMGNPARNSRKTHCPKGHPYGDRTTYVSRLGWRYCQICSAERKKTPAVLAKRRARRAANRQAVVGDGYIRTNEAAAILGFHPSYMRQPGMKARLGIVTIMGRLYVPRANLPK